MDAVIHNPGEGIYPATPDYVHAIEVRKPNRLVYVSGTMGLDAGGVAGETLEEQLGLVWSNIRAILASAGMTVANIIRVTISARLRIRGSEPERSGRGTRRAGGSDNDDRCADLESRLAGRDRDRRRGLTVLGALELGRRMTGGPMEEHMQPRVVRAQQRVRQAALQTAGVLREQAFSTDDVWIGIVTTEPGAMSAWHHHGDHDTYAYVVSGLKRIEYGPGGTGSLVARPEDFIHLPKGLMHREGNPSEEVSYSIAFRLGRGPATINVEGPP